MDNYLSSLQPLYCFQQVAKFGNVTKASAVLNISQPALSKTIGKLEDELGCPLFDRTSNTITLNDAGKNFLEHVERIFLEADKAKSDINQMDVVEHNRLSVAVACPQMLNNFAERFILSNPDIRVEERITSVTDMRMGLENGSIDVALSITPIESKSISWQPLFTERVSVLMSKDHRLAQKNSVSLSELADEDFVLYAPIPDAAQEVYQNCKAAGFIPKVRYLGNSLSPVMHLVERCMGITFSTALSPAVEDNYEKGYRICNPNIMNLPIDQPVWLRTTGIAMLNNSARKKCVSKFYAEVINEFLNNIPSILPRSTM
jgi:DNA-binding transcriptional LysR family regulator